MCHPIKCSVTPHSKIVVCLFSCAGPQRPGHLFISEPLLFFSFFRGTPLLPAGVVCTLEPPPGLLPLKLSDTDPFYFGECAFTLDNFCKWPP